MTNPTEFLLKQNSVSGGEATSATTVQITRREEDHHKVIIEYAHLRAVITQSLAAEEEQIRVTAADLDATIKVLKEYEEKTEFEKKWQFLRQMFVNQIFANTRKGSDLYIKGSVLMGYYKWVQTERGLADDVISNINLSRKVYWFLKELSVVAPDKSSDSTMEESMDINRQKLELLRQHLLSKMDDMAFLKSVAMKFKSLKSSNPEMEQLFKQLESGEVKAENYGLFGKLLREIFEGEDESVSQHIALLDHLQKAIQANNPSEMLINHLRKDLSMSLGIKNFPGLRENDIIAEEHARGQSGENGKSKITQRTLERQINKQSDSKNLHDFEDFILVEIENAAESPKKNIRRKDEDSVKSSRKVESENSSDSSESKESSIDSKTRNGSKDIDRQDKIEIAMEREIDFMENIDLQETGFHGMTDEHKHRQKRLSYKEVSIDEDMAFAFPKASEIKSNSVSLEEVTKDERQKLLQEIQKELSDSQSSHKNEKKSKVSDSTTVTSEEIRSSDSLEDFKKPVWASDEGKIMKEFSEFQQKSEISGAEYCSAHKNDFGCQEEFVIKDESANTEKGDRHNGDEL